MPQDMPNRNHEYDEGLAQDHTGMSFKHIPGKGRTQEDYLFRNPRLVPCGNCGTEDRWRFIADDHPQSGLGMLQCGKCKARSRPFEMRVPQMDDHRAKALGLYVPRAAIDTYIDIER